MFIAHALQCRLALRYQEMRKTGSTMWEMGFIVE